jgi:hypothetical protein
MRPSARWALGIVVLALSLAATAGVAAAGQRYASPTGTMAAPCTSASPCDLTTAIQNAANTDEVIVNPGSYPLSSMVTVSKAVTIHGVAGQAKPVITSSAFTALTVSNAGATIRLLDIRDTAAGGGALIFNGTTAEQISARGGGSGNGACNIQAGTLRDSVCVASDAGAAGVLAGTGIGTIALRNVTAINTNATAGTGLLTQGSGTPSLVVNASNVIAHGVTDVTVKGVTGSDASTLNIDHSDYATKSVASGSTLTDGGGHQLGAPKFVNAASGDYREAAGSPTIDTGLDNLANGSLDVEGDPRQIGTTDIGADEYVVPVVSAVKATATGSTSASVRATINPNGADTTYYVNYGPTAALGSSTQQLFLAAGTTAQSVLIALNDLAFGATYHFVVVATNHGGTATTADQTFTTTGVSDFPQTTQPTVTVPPPPPFVPVVTAPSIGALSASPSRFASSGHKKTVHHGTTLVVKLSAAASVHFEVDVQATGRVVGTRCVKQTSSNRAKTRCDLSKKVGSFTKKLATGTTKVAFSGKVSGRALAPGGYTVTAVATANGKSSAARLAKFTVVRG